MILVYTLKLSSWLCLMAFTSAIDERNCGSKTSRLTETWWDRQVSTEDIAHKLIDSMEAHNIETNLKYLTSKPHMAGTRADFEQAEYIRSLWADQGLDHVTLTPYEVVLSFPKIGQTSKIVILDENNAVKFTSALRETPEEGATYDETVPPAYIAFSADGIIEANELVFANYGSYDDFKYLEENLNITVEGKLLLIRYGKFFRGDKVQNAQRFKAAGIILYSDPADYSSSDTDTVANYPGSWWLPGEGIQRGTINWRDGDPSTPMYPALDGVYRVPAGSWKDMPTIPVHPVGFNDAAKILVQMAGPEVPLNWRGGLNTSYRLGPQLRMPGWKIRLEVHNDKQLVPTYNVIGFIRGQVEPDRYVIYGNHRDAWVFGSVDPSSATSTLLEVVRSYSLLLKQGWRPRRSLMFCSWGASEQGYMGATEWVEEHLSILGARAVAHMNVDIAVVHNYNLLAVASPLLHKVMADAAANIPAPHGNRSLLNMWTERKRFTKEKLIGYGLSSVSDHAPFYQRAGVPCTYMLWMPNPAEWASVDYPLYHSTYETFDAMKKFLDPDFTYHLALGRMWAWMGLSLANSPILPFEIQDETFALKRFSQVLREKYNPVLSEHGISLAYLDSAVSIFESSATNFQHRLNQLENSNELILRMINDQLMQVEKAFIYSEGLPRRPYLKNVVFGTSIFDQYAGSTFPGVEEALIHLTFIKDKSDLNQTDEWDEVRHQLGIVTSVIRAAAKILRDFNTW